MTISQNETPPPPYCLNFNAKQLKVLMASSNWRILHQALSNNLNTVAQRRFSNSQEVFRQLELACRTALDKYEEKEPLVWVAFSPPLSSQTNIKGLFSHLNALLEAAPNDVSDATLHPAGQLPARKDLAAAIDAFKTVMQSSPMWNEGTKREAERPDKRAVRIRHGRPGVTVVDI